ncbi:MAG: hypothetical protein JRI25_25245 [Deltaproteobacteria bacterium]|nr:hypothetical protein [Deltaproteobacteria bacterium]
MSAPTNDFCANALTLLGLAGGVLETCTPFLPDQYWVVATRGNEGYAGTVVLHDGVPDQRRGLAAGAAWLRRIEIYEVESINPVALCDGLEWLEALPETFEAAHLTDHEDRSGETRFSKTPFRLELRMIEVPVVPEGAGDVFEGASYGAGGGGLPPQRRAILTGDSEYRFTWTIERRDGGGAWEPVSVAPCE